MQLCGYALPIYVQNLYSRSEVMIPLQLQILHSVHRRTGVYRKILLLPIIADKTEQILEAFTHNFIAAVQRIF
jgi:hypothetical protein